MKTINVRVERANFLVSSGPGSLQNFTVEEEEIDLNSVTGYGPTLELALNAFEVMYECRHDEEIRAVIVEQAN